MREGVRNTRQADNGPQIYPDRAKLDLRKNWYTNRVAEEWNRLPKEIKLDGNLARFKKFLLTQAKERTRENGQDNRP